MGRKPSCPKPIHKTIGRFAPPNIGSNKKFPRRCPRPYTGGLSPPWNAPIMGTRPPLCPTQWTRGVVTPAAHVTSHGKNTPNNALPKLFLQSFLFSSWCSLFACTNLVGTPIPNVWYPPTNLLFNISVKTESSLYSHFLLNNFHYFSGYMGSMCPLVGSGGFHIGLAPSARELPPSFTSSMSIGRAIRRHGKKQDGDGKGVNKTNMGSRLKSTQTNEKPFNNNTDEKRGDKEGSMT